MNSIAGMKQTLLTLTLLKFFLYLPAPPRYLDTYALSFSREFGKLTLDHEE